MKRLLAVAFGICIVGSVLAQSSFTIVRPADGSKVREKVRVLIPKNSLDDGSYVGVFLNGRFVEAVVPPIEGNYRVYTLNTKAPTGIFPSGIPDGEMKLELVKYEGGDTPRISDRSSVTVTVGNQMNIPIPAGGVKLRYGFSPNQQMVYSVHEIRTVSTLSGIGNDNGGRPASFPQSDLTFRLLYAVDNTYSNGDALLRMQILPDKGKDYAIMPVENEPDLKQIFDFQMQPVYMRINSTARPVFGAIPEYFGFSAGTVPEGGVSVYGSWPLPVLPEKPVVPGANWRAAYMVGWHSSEEDPHLTDKVAMPYDARGDFIDVEWELGHPCAKIRNSIAAGTRSFQGDQLAKAGKTFADDKVSLDETIYFSLDTHKILKLVRTITIDRKGQIVQSGGGNNGGGPGTRGGGLGPGAAPGAAPGRPGLNIRQGGRGGGLPGGRGGGPGPGSVPGAAGGGGAQGTNRGGGAGPARTQYIRVVSQQTFTLEK